MTCSGIKSLGFACALAAAWPGPARAADPVELLKRHRYEEAIATWDKDLGGKPNERVLRAWKGQAVAYSRLGSLYEEFNRFSRALMGEYYSSLVQGNASPLVYLYLGQIQYYDGNYAQAKISLEKARKSAGSGSSVGQQADAFLFYANKRAAGGGGEWSPKGNDNSAAWEAVELRGGGPGQAQGLAANTQRARRIRLQLMLRDPNPDAEELRKALRPVLEDAASPEAYFDQGKNTQINFYDPYLLATLSQAFYAMAKSLDLRIRAEEKAFPDLAAKFGTNQALAEASLKLGQAKEAEEYLGKDSTPDGQLLRAGILAKQGKGAEAKAALEALVRKSKGAPTKRDVAAALYQYNLDLDRGLELAGQAAKEKSGPAYQRTYASILFNVGEYDAALQQYAKGYKIEYRNRIDQIDPEYMSEYAYAIFRTNKLRYEEIVETLYHLQKEFPPCRQMYYCMQGISAGLTRDYESQKIFRKSG